MIRLDTISYDNMFSILKEHDSDCPWNLDFLVPARPFTSLGSCCNTNERRVWVYSTISNRGTYPDIWCACVGRFSASRMSTYIYIYICHVYHTIVNVLITESSFPILVLPAMLSVLHCLYGSIICPTIPVLQYEQFLWVMLSYTCSLTYVHSYIYI